MSTDLKQYKDCGCYDLWSLSKRLRKGASSLVSKLYMAVHIGYLIWVMGHLMHLGKKWRHILKCQGIQNLGQL